MQWNEVADLWPGIERYEHRKCRGIAEQSEDSWSLMRPTEVPQFDKDQTESEVFCTADFIYSKFIARTE